MNLKRPDSSLRLAPAYIHPILRAVCAALLTIALLSAALPLAALSASHSCSMPCCAEGVCSTGTCKDALFKTHIKSQKKAEVLCGAEHEKAAEDSAKTEHSKTLVETADHCDTDKKETASDKKDSAASQSPAESSQQSSAFINTRAVASPCSKDCCAGTSASTQSRRGRDSSLISRPNACAQPIFISLALYSLTLRPATSAHLKRLRARAPPMLLQSAQARLM